MQMPLISDDLSTDLSSRRTSMAFQRTRLAADRTLMAVIRTSLSLMSFGFTIHQLAQKLKAQGLLPSDGAERNFGGALILIAIATLILGIVYHLRFMYQMRKERKAMVAEKQLHSEDKFPPSQTLITALLLLLVGCVTIISITW
jgi:putative membrane protein